MTDDNIETIDLMVTPHQLAEIIRRAHAIGEREENQIGIENYPREWQDMIVTALEALGAAQTPTGQHDTIYLRGWNEGVERAAELLEEEGSGTPAEKIRVLLDRAFPVPSTQEKPLRKGQAAPSDAFIDAFHKAEGSFIEAYEAPRESGVAMDLDISQDDADAFNAEARNSFRRAWASALTSTQEKPLSVCSRCGGKDPDCYICGAVVASTHRRGACQLCGQISDLKCGPSRFGHETWACDECWNPGASQVSSTNHGGGK